MASYFLAPDPIQSTFFIPGTNTPGNGVQLFVYTAGTTTKTTVYKDNAGGASWTNPIVLDSGGNLPSGGVVWILSGTKIKVVWAPSNDTDPPTSPYRTIDNISGINDTSQTASQWFIGPTPTFIGATQFSLSGDQTGTYTLGRRIQASVTAGTVYGTITAASFGAGFTTVTVLMDPGQVLDAGLTTLSYGIVSFIHTSAPLPYASADTIAVAANLDLEANYGNVITGSSATVSSVVLAQGKTRTLTASTFGLTITTSATLVTQSGRPLVAAANDRITFDALNGVVYASILRSVYPMVSITVGSTTVGVSTLQALSGTPDINDGNYWVTSGPAFNVKIPGRYLATAKCYAALTAGAAAVATISWIRNSSSTVGMFQSVGINTSEPLGLSCSVLTSLNGIADNLALQFQNGSSTGIASIGGLGWTICKVDP
jgi:hypothetical protein